MHFRPKKRDEQRGSDSDKVAGGAGRSQAKKDNGINAETAENTEFTEAEKNVGKSCDALGKAIVAEWTALDGDGARRVESRRGCYGREEQSEA